jgi:hypothetical protein
LRILRLHNEELHDLYTLFSIISFRCTLQLTSLSQISKHLLATLDKLSLLLLKMESRVAGRADTLVPSGDDHVP